MSRESTAARHAAAPGSESTDLRGVPERIQASRIQRTIAQRMLAVTTEVPAFTLRDEVDAAALKQLRAAWPPLDSGRPTVNDLIVKASAVALAQHPRLNASWDDGVIERFPRVNIGIAVAADDLLLVATVLDADQLPIRDLARETRRLALAVRGHTITPAELSGATFTISNLGMFGILDFDAIISTPQASILAVAAAREQPVVRDGAVVPGVRMGLRLTCDHRLVYGADGAAFMRTLCGLLERPHDWAA
jgi:pyruvate dehydrogenase E2 component (dihydrolipoamide acetyltransferase)